VLRYFYFLFYFTVFLFSFLFYGIFYFLFCFTVFFFSFLFSAEFRTLTLRLSRGPKLSQTATKTKSSHPLFSATLRKCHQTLDSYKDVKRNPRGWQTATR